MERVSNACVATLVLSAATRSRLNLFIGGRISFMSWTGHILFGVLAATILKKRQAGETV